MFGIGLFELLIIGLAILIFFGPQKLPELAQQVGRFYVQLRRMTSDVRSTFDEAMRKAEYDLMIEERNKLQALINAQPPSTPAAVTNPDVTKDTNAGNTSATVSEAAASIAAEPHSTVANVAEEPQWDSVATSPAAPNDAKES